MWETPFDIAMLEHGNIIIHCPSKELASELFRIFLDNGVRWNGDEPMSETHWTSGEEDTCYRITSHRTIKYGRKGYYSDDSEYDDYIKCTFYGIEPPDFDVASDDELQALLGIGGV